MAGQEQQRPAGPAPDDQRVAEADHGVASQGRDRGGSRSQCRSVPSSPVTEGMSTSQVRVSAKVAQICTPRSRRNSLRLVFSSVFSVR